jgi:hypothetical protein
MNLIVFEPKVTKPPGFDLKSIIIFFAKVFPDSFLKLLMEFVMLLIKVD